MNELDLMFSVMPNKVIVISWLSNVNPTVINLEFSQFPFVYRIPDSLMLISVDVSVNDVVSLSFAFKE